MRTLLLIATICMWIINAVLIYETISNRSDSARKIESFRERIAIQEGVIRDLRKKNILFSKKILALKYDRRVIAREIRDRLLWTSDRELVFVLSADR